MMRSSSRISRSWANLKMLIVFMAYFITPASGQMSDVAVQAAPHGTQVARNNGRWLSDRNPRSFGKPGARGIGYSGWWGMS
jgi:hypothetical protein